jgi:hypothetical protein
MADEDLDVKIGRVLHSIGISFISIVILTLFTLSIISFKLVNRLSIRLIFILSLADFVVHLSELLALGTGYLIGTSRCHVISALRYFGRLFYCSTNILISIHLYRSIIQLKTSSLKLEMYSWLFMLFILSVIMVIMGFLGVYSGVKKIECRPGSDNFLYFQIEEGLIGVISIVALLTCFIIYLISRKQFNKSITQYADLYITDYVERDKFLVKRNRMLVRSFLYPLATLITLPAPIALSVMDLTGYYRFPIFEILAVSQGLSGILTFIVFSLDPAVWNSLELAKYKVMKKSKGKFRIM